MFRVLLWSALALPITACEFTPHISRVSLSRPTQESFQINVEVNAEDVSKIVSEEYYFSIVLINCSGEPARYPIEPYVGERRASEFESYNTAGNITFSGNVPSTIMRQYTDPCIFLEGGSYFSGRILSPVVQINSSELQGLQ